MKTLFLSITLSLFTISLWSQDNQKISTLEFVQVLEDNTEETLFYYHNNWEQLRKSAIKNGYIDSYELMLVFDTESDYQIILKTTYKNQTQYDKRETHFQKLIENHGALKLLNDKKPKEFRKTLFGSEVKHL
ncbi:hypothetical protein [Winogradskyella sp. 3972H.M.0a.05]|uniref:hypothetical protein n=1 Tax=Winogradskyella sp. 3972H.M.0a.05 TaxID=2950277 RepID=UPI0033962412